MNRIYLSPPSVGAAERLALLDAFDSNWIAPVGPALERFERAAAELTATANACALASGTAALHLGLEVLGVEAGDEVVVADFTFAATAFAVTHLGATPSFVDADRMSWCMDPNLLEDHLESREAAGSRPKAIIPVDLYGQCADYAAIRQIADRWEIPVLQDAAEALGATHRGKAAGAQGDLACLSFNGNKIVTTSGGGMLVGDDAELIDRARHLATQAREPVLHYEHRDIGYNYRLSNLLAALGRAQLERLPSKLAARARNNAAYRAALDGIEGIEFMPIADHGTPNHWLTVICVDPEGFGATRDDIIETLEVDAIEARPAWKPMHEQPVFAHHPTTGGAVAGEVFERGVCLPSGDDLGDDLQRVVEAVLSCRGGRRGRC